MFFIDSVNSTTRWCLPLLQQYLPAPTGLDEATFYGALRTYALRIDRLKWQGPAFAADFKARIVDPGKHARDVMGRWPYLTRMFTTISPTEMSLDPTFHARPDLNNEQITPRQTATRRTTCGGKSAMILPDTREVAISQKRSRMADLLERDAVGRTHRRSAAHGCGDHAR